MVIFNSYVNLPEGKFNASFFFMTSHAIVVSVFNACVSFNAWKLIRYGRLGLPEDKVPHSTGSSFSLVEPFISH